MVRGGDEGGEVDVGKVWKGGWVLEEVFGFAGDGLRKV